MAEVRNREEVRQCCYHTEHPNIPSGLAPMKYLENSLAGWYGIDLMYILAYMVEIMVTIA